MRQERPCLGNLEGYARIIIACLVKCLLNIFVHRAFEEDDGKTMLSCRTEKDRHIRLNHRTAGMLMQQAF
jgi:hypothetical protein